MCECIENVNAMLADRNTRLAQALVFGGNPNPGLMVETEQIETGRGKKKAATVFPSFCPFCGEEYPKKEGA